MWTSVDMEPSAGLVSLSETAHSGELGAVLKRQHHRLPPIIVASGVGSHTPTAMHC